jgi:hypothetical protein
LRPHKRARGDGRPSTVGALTLRVSAAPNKNLDEDFLQKYRSFDVFWWGLRGGVRLNRATIRGFFSTSGLLSQEESLIFVFLHNLGFDLWAFMS